MFKSNVGNTDRILRVILGVVLLGAFFMYPESPWRMAFLVGIIPLATGLFGTCLIYSIFGISTGTKK